MFAVKNMDSLLKLKLDMVYRDLPVEEAQKKFAETMPQPVEPKQQTKPKKKVIKTIVVKK